MFMVGEVGEKSCEVGREDDLEVRSGLGDSGTELRSGGIVGENDSCRQLDGL